MKIYSRERNSSMPTPLAGGRTPEEVITFDLYKMISCIALTTALPFFTTLFLLSSWKAAAGTALSNFIYFHFIDFIFLVTKLVILTKISPFSQTLSYKYYLLGVQNQVIPFSILIIRWNKLPLELPSTLGNDTFQFTPFA